MAGARPVRACSRAASCWKLALCLQSSWLLPPLPQVFGLLWGWAGGPLLLLPLPSLKPGLLPGLLASNRLAPSCLSIQFLGKATASASGDREEARTELYSVHGLSYCPYNEYTK